MDLTAYKEKFKIGKELTQRDKIIYLYDDLVKHIPKNSKLCAAMIFRGKYIGAEAVREIVDKIKALKEKPKDPIPYFMKLSGEYTTKLQ